MSPTATSHAAHALTAEERARLDASPWFAGLAPALRDDLLARGQVRRVRHTSRLAVRGQPAQEWIGIASGAVRLSSVVSSGRQVTLAYARPGAWLCDSALLDGQPHAHDLNAQGDSTLLVVRRQDFRELLKLHAGLEAALLQLQCRRLRVLFEQIESFATLPLPARLARQLLSLAHDFGRVENDGIRIGLHLAQEDLAQLLGASRQRVNRELKNFERLGALRVEPSGLVILEQAPLRAAMTATG